MEDLTSLERGGLFDSLARETMSNEKFSEALRPTTEEPEEPEEPEPTYHASESFVASINSGDDVSSRAISASWFSQKENPHHTTSYIGQPMVVQPEAKVVSYKPPKNETCCHYVCGRPKKHVTGAMPRRAKIATVIGVIALLAIIVAIGGLFRWEKTKNPANDKANRYYQFTGPPTRQPALAPTKSS
ncbi:hypothetical protein CTAYLR_005254 [Chrysophaeum taylorii]|uniref:Uncharacterized protein n=1 Tax=Chrysophaeum taylorii TaxID=2483200 RepID=A0AAD7UKX8_9STRA|nr:hypothetical protein CTAYLR_005254 [Chrysophaeum taylorii]